MSNLTERHIIGLMHDEYRRRLQEVMQESDVFDSRGNMILGKDLKVHHKESGLEYTVDDVLSDPDTGNLKVVLRLPDEPRVEPPGEEGVIADTPGVLGEEDLVEPQEEPGDLSLVSKQEDPLPQSGALEDEEVFVIDQEEFEKEYEVK